jgi:outer membrane biosynthesis protein TonB
MKKFLVLLLVMAMVMTGFTACGSKDDAEGETPDVNTEVNADAETEGEEAEGEAEAEGETAEGEAEAEKEEEPVKEEEKKEEPKAEDKKEESKPADKKEESKPAEKPAAKAPTGSPAEIIDQIYAKFPVAEMPLGTIEIDINDADMLKMFTGLSSASQIESAAASEAMMGSQAYSLVVVKAKSTGDAADVMEEMVNGIDQRKWICVEADDMSAASCGNVVVLMMVGSVHADTVTSANIIDAFSAVCGGLDARA